MDERIFSITEEVQRPLYSDTDWCRHCRGYLLTDRVNKSVKGGVLRDQGLRDTWIVCLGIRT
jgi:hypothetical protein